MDSWHHIRRVYCLPVLTCLLFLLQGCETFDDLPQEASLDTWKQYNTSNGMPGDNTWCIYEDSEGMIWVGSRDRGLLIYDGTSWGTLSTAHGLADNYVTAIEQDVNGDMWIGTLNGFSVWDGYGFASYVGIDSNLWTVLSIRSDLEGDIWIGTMEHGLFEVTSDGINEYSFTTNDDANNVNDIDVAGDGTVWAATGGGAYSIKGTNVKFYTTANGLSSDNVKAVYCDEWGDVWLGTWEAPFITRYHEGNFEKISLFNSSETVNVNEITGDSMGNIWFALVADGAVKYDGAAMRSYRVSDGLPGITIMDIVTDKNGRIWFSSFEDGLATYTPGTEN